MRRDGLASGPPDRSNQVQNKRHDEGTESTPSASKVTQHRTEGTGAWKGPWTRGWEPYLLVGGVFHSVGIVIIIDDVQILHCVAREGTGELHVQWGFAGPFGVDSEVGWLPVFHAWKDTP